eukprot:Nitzschia sp. Nitz4//scaffold77_size91520//50582//51787//NITZ4_004893-RA/size91520-processed-gene-0.34-mRNA-1//1//CDS//3329558000//7595//frame0
MSENTCSICLEPLLVADSSEGDENHIGAAIPCGHCFHVNCFAMWKASRSHQACKCPNCNKPARDCVRIFIAPPDFADQHVSSDASEYNENSDDDTEKPETNQVEIIDDCEVVDLVSSPVTSNKQDSDSKLKKYKARAASYKQKYKQIKSQLQAKMEEFRSTLSLYHDTKAALETKEGMIQEFAEIEEENDRRVRDLSHSVATLQQDKDDTAVRLQQYTSKYNQVRGELEALRANYKKDIEKARSSTMVELKQMLDEHPKLLKENNQLRANNAKLNERVRQLIAAGQRRPLAPSNARKVSADSSSTAVLQPEPSKRRKITDLTKELRRLDHQYPEANKSSSKDASEDASRRPVTGKYSSTSLRMASASQPKYAVKRTNAKALLAAAKPPPRPSSHNLWAFSP